MKKGSALTGINVIKQAGVNGLIQMGCVVIGGVRECHPPDRGGNGCVMGVAQYGRA